jgi:formylglycine-generating enzyme required for sulfatase activity
MKKGKTRLIGLATLLLCIFYLSLFSWTEDRNFLVLASDIVSPPNMISIPGGVFAMGDHYGYVDPSHPSDEVPLHDVAISSFKMGKNDITVEQYCLFLNSAYSSAKIRVTSGGLV